MSKLLRVAANYQYTAVSFRHDKCTASYISLYFTSFCHILSFVEHLSYFVLECIALSYLGEFLPLVHSLESL